MLSLTFSPNNQISLKVHKPPVPPSGRERDRARSLPPTDVGGGLFDLSPSGYFASLGLPVDWEDDCFAYPARGGSSLSLTENINNRGGGWGQPAATKTRFGRTPKTWLYRAGGALEHIGLGAGKSAFFTGTLPGSSDRAVRALASWTGYIANRVTQWFRNVNLPYWGYVWEFQKRGALHIHAFAASEDTELLDRLIDQFRPFWISVLRDVSDLSEVNLFEKKDGSEWDSFKDMLTFRSRGEWVRKSICAYLCKYLGKGSSSEELPVEYYPSRWWGMSTSLKQLSRDMTEVRVIELTWEQEMELALEIQEHVGGFATKQSHYEHPYSGGESHTFISYVPFDMWQDCKYLLTMFEDSRYRTSSLAAKLLPLRTLQLLQYFRGRITEREFFMSVMSINGYPDIEQWFPALMDERTMDQFIPESAYRMCICAMDKYADMVGLSL